MVNWTNDTLSANDNAIKKLIYFLHLIIVRHRSWILQISASKDKSTFCNVLRCLD